MSSPPCMKSAGSITRSCSNISMATTTSSNLSLIGKPDIDEIRAVIAQLQHVDASRVMLMAAGRQPGGVKSQSRSGSSNRASSMASATRRACISSCSATGAARDAAWRGITNANTDFKFQIPGSQITGMRTSDRTQKFRLDTAGVGESTNHGKALKSRRVFRSPSLEKRG